MKNEIILRIIALATLAVLCLGAVSCGSISFQRESDIDMLADATESIDDEVSSNGGNGGNGENGSGLSSSAEEDLFAELLKAYNASMDYKGAISATSSQFHTTKQGEQEESAKQTVSMGLDSDGKRYFATTESEYGDEKYITTEKIFTVDGNLYEYSYSKYFDQWNNESTDFYKLPADLDPAEKYGGVTELIELFAGGTFKAKTFAELKEAYNKVLSEIKTRCEKEFKKDGMLKEGATFDLVPDITIKEANGEISLTITQRVFISELSEGNSTMSNYSSVYTRVIACKNGKINRVDMDVRMDATEQIGGTETLPQETPAHTETKRDPEITDNETLDDMTNAPELDGNYPYDDYMTGMPEPEGTHPEHVMTDVPGFVVTAPSTNDSGRVDTADNGRYEDFTVVNGKNMASAREDGQKTTETMNMEMTMNYDIFYTFDQNGYDAIDSTLPEDPSDISDDSESNSGFIPVAFADGFELEICFIQDYDDPAKLLELVQEIVDFRLKQGYFDKDYDERADVTVTALYKDAERTQLIDTSTITVQQILSLDKIYADYTVAEGKALIVHKYDSVYELSLEYQIVCTNIFDELDFDYYAKDMEICDVGDYYNIVCGINERVSVNGKETTEHLIVPESTKSYVITHTSVYTDKDFGLEDLIMVGMF